MKNLPSKVKGCPLPLLALHLARLHRVNPLHDYISNPSEAEAWFATLPLVPAQPETTAKRQTFLGLRMKQGSRTHPHYTRDSPAFLEPRNKSAAIVEDIHRQTKFQPQGKKSTNQSPHSRTGSDATSSSQSGSTTQVNIIIDPPASDDAQDHGSPESVASTKCRKTSTESDPLPSSVLG